MKIHDFSVTDQEEAAELVLGGLEEHWGWRDPTLNSDLRDIGSAFRDGCFLVGTEGDRIIATGGLIPHAPETAEIVRMSVAPDCRRRGMAKQMLEALCERARSFGYRSVMLETTAAWSEVVRFYESQGFVRTHDVGDDAYFSHGTPRRPPPTRRSTGSASTKRPRPLATRSR